MKDLATPKSDMKLFGKLTNIRMTLNR